MPRFSRLVLASCLAGSALGFEQLAGFKMPSLQGMQKAAQNKAKFGDKKLAIVTGTSSGARQPPHARSAPPGPGARAVLCASAPPHPAAGVPSAPCSGAAPLTAPRAQASDARRSSTSCAPANTTSLGPCATWTRSAAPPSPGGLLFRGFLHARIAARLAPPHARIPSQAVMAAAAPLALVQRNRLTFRRVCREAPRSLTPCAVCCAGRWRQLPS